MTLKPIMVVDGVTYCVISIIWWPADVDQRGSEAEDTNFRPVHGLPGVHK